LSAAAGIVVPAFVKAGAAYRVPNPALIRPPGALAEPDFVARCVRCGECMKVCINNALHPAGLEAGIEGLFSPRLVPRLGYCEYNCTLCGQVCPTGAIQRLPVLEKQRTVIGRAVFDHNRCLPWAKGIPCLVCEEHCPTPEKSIQLREVVVQDQDGNDVTLKQPFVVDRLCIGCGICENKCPLPDEAAVRVIREGESRNPDSAGALVAYP
jgi:MauM/NapG family ferredoxin protein